MRAASRGVAGLLRLGRFRSDHFAGRPIKYCGRAVGARDGRVMMFCMLEIIFENHRGCC